MKTTVEYNNKEQEIKYPFIGISDNGNIVLFHKEREGICIGQQGPSNHYIGYYYDLWIMSKFKHFNGKITLEND